MNDGGKRGSFVVSAVTSMMHIGITIASCIIVGVFLGRFLDRVIGTSPWLLILFSLLGVAAAFKSIFSTLMAKDRTKKQENIKRH